MFTVPFTDITPTRLLWVSTAGSDATGDGSLTHPFLTLQVAVNHARPGTAIMVEAGTYVGNTAIRPEHGGTPTAPVWIISADGPGMAHLVAARNDPVIHGAGVSNIVVDGFWISGGKAGVSFSQGGFDYTKLISNIVVENNLIEGAALDGIKANGGDHIYVLGNTITGGARDEAIDFLAINDSVISNNEVANITGVVAMYVKGGSTNDVISDNYIHDVPYDGIGVGNHMSDASFFRPGYTGYEAKNVLVTGNVVVNAGGRALVAIAAIDSTVSDNFLGTNGSHYAIVVNSDQITDQNALVTLYSSNLTITNNVLASTDYPLLVKPGNEAGLVFQNNPMGTLILGSSSPDHLTGDVGVNYLQGLAGDDFLAGLGGDDALHGGLGDDTLDGGSGDDTLDGGPGTNTASYADTLSGVRVSLALQGAPQDTGGAGDDTLVNIQNLVGSPYNDRLTGDANVNVLDGGAGDDTLIGSGNDTASYADAAVGVTVNLALTGAQNTHGAGVDTLRGIANLIGSSHDDVLTGDGGNNVLTGGAGDDKLIGGPGADTLTGGAGADRFVFRAATDSTVAPSGQDVITDFSHAQGDHIVLTAIDANLNVAGNQGFTLVSSFTEQAGQLVQVAHAGGYLVEGDVNGDGVPDFAIVVDTTAPLVASDFLL